MNTDITRRTVLVGEFSSIPAAVLVVAVVSPTSDAPTAIATNSRVEYAEAFFISVRRINCFMQGFLNRSTREHLHSSMTILLQPGGLMPIIYNLVLVLINRCQYQSYFTQRLYL